MSRINWHKTALIVLAVMATVVFAPISSAALVPYSQDFEAMTPGGGFPPDNDLSKDGWVVYADVWFGSVGTGVFVYNYGPFGAPDDTGGFSAIAGGEGDVNQGAQYLVTYSDYNNPDQTAGGSCGSSGCIINTSVFQERNIDAGDIGSVWALTFDAKSPLTGGISDAAIDNLDNYLEYPTSASAFIKTLDPSSGYNTTNDIRVDMTNISNTEWATFTISLDLSDPLLVGQILQFGFNTVTTEYDNSGVYYDNISFSRVAEIDVKPGSFPNSINVGSRGKIPVAILTTAYFDAGTVDVSSIQFGPGKAHPDHYALEDVDGDTDWDLILHFNTQEVGITCGDMEVTIAGQTIDAVAFLGADSINTVGCE